MYDQFYPGYGNGELHEPELIRDERLLYGIPPFSFGCSKSSGDGESACHMFQGGYDTPPEQKRVCTGGV